MPKTCENLVPIFFLPKITCEISSVTSIEGLLKGYIRLFKGLYKAISALKKGRAFDTVIFFGVWVIIRHHEDILGAG